MEKKSRFRAYARFLGAAFTANLLAVMEYRVNFLIQVFGMMLNNAAFALFWGVLIDRTGGVGGYGFSDIMFVWAVVSSAFGIAHIVFGNIRQLGRIIMQGELDLYLLQPKDVFINVLVSKTSVSAWGDFIYGFIVIALLPGFGLGRLLMFGFLSLSGGLIFAATFAAAESLSFFLGNSSALSAALTEFLLSFSLYPETIYDRGMRWVFYTILPSGFIAFVPLAVYKAMDWRFVPLLLLAALAYSGLSYALFQAGLKRYESGNQIGTRM